MAQSGMAASEIGRFWDWFSRNRSALEAVRTGEEKVLDRLHAKLAAVAEGLVFEIGRHPDQGFEFIISADRIRELFPAVIELAKAAPRINGWIIVPFRPRLDAGYAVEFGPHDLRADAVWYKTEMHKDQPGIILYVDSAGAGDQQSLFTASYILLSSVLGEYDTVTRLSFVEMEPLPSNPAARGLRPLHELPAEIDAFYCDKLH